VGGDAMSKYHAIKTTIDGIVFASKREATRYQELKLMERAGLISCLELQPVFRLIVKTGKSVGVYKADFKFWDVATKQWIIEDSKGVRTPVYRLKKRIVEEVYQIKISEV
jgi:hypothetical protein